MKIILSHKIFFRYFTHVRRQERKKSDITQDIKFSKYDDLQINAQFLCPKLLYKHITTLLLNLVIKIERGSFRYCNRFIN